jgi:hypothetical protein
VVLRDWRKTAKNTTLASALQIFGGEEKGEREKLTCTLPVDKGSVTQQLPPKIPNVNAPTATLFSKNKPALNLSNSSWSCTPIAPLLASESIRAYPGISLYNCSFTISTSSPKISYTVKEPERGFAL